MQKLFILRKICLFRPLCVCYNTSRRRPTCFQCSYMCSSNLSPALHRLCGRQTLMESLYHSRLKYKRVGHYQMTKMIDLSISLICIQDINYLFYVSFCGKWDIAISLRDAIIKNIVSIWQNIYWTKTNTCSNPRLCTGTKRHGSTGFIIIIQYKIECPSSSFLTTFLNQKPIPILMIFYQYYHTPHTPNVSDKCMEVN